MEENVKYAEQSFALLYGQKLQLLLESKVKCLIKVRGTFTIKDFSGFQLFSVVTVL